MRYIVLNEEGLEIDGVLHVRGSVVDLEHAVPGGELAHATTTRYSTRFGCSHDVKRRWKNTPRTSDA